MADVYLYNNEMWRVKYKFTYTGEMERFHLNEGEYLCICKGAKGGTVTNGLKNFGGCSYGILNLTSPLTAYAVVGGDGGDGIRSTTVYGEGGFNGGGHGGFSCNPGTYDNGAGGGGASDIRLLNRDNEEIPKIHKIPDDFDELEYIQSDGTQYIDTEAIHKANTKIEFNGEVIANTDRNYEAIFGARNSSNSKQMTFFTRYSGSDIPCYGSSSTETRGTDFLYNQSIKVVVNSNVVSWYDSNGSLISSITGDTQVDGEKPMFLFDINNGGDPNRSKSKAKLSSFKMWEGDTLIRYMVPFRNNGVVIDTSSITWEQGTIVSSGNSGSNSQIRTAGYIPIESGIRYISGLSNPSSCLVNFMTYDFSKQLVADLNWVSSGGIVDIGPNIAYIRIVIKKNNGGDMSPSYLTSFELRSHKSNAKIGLYDLVNDQIYSKAAGNEFTIGEVKSTKTEYSGMVQIPVGLLSRIMVAGGAGGCGNVNGIDGYSDFTAYGGGINGGYPCVKNGLIHNHEYPTQKSGYSFGKGEDGLDKTNSTSPSTNGGEGICGAGGGWYGGYASNTISPSVSYSSGNGGGGSGYILTESSYKPEDYLYGIPERDDLYFSNTLMTSGLSNESCVIICEKTMAYSSGDRIICDCIGNGTSFPLYAGTYNIRCSGGQGAHRTKYAYARKGGYAEGLLNNPDITTAYAYVGGSGLYTASNMNATFVQTTHPTASFNGGGKPSGYGTTSVSGEAAGGGTDLRIGTDSLYARVIVAGGAGGCGRSTSYGGAGGGQSGNSYEGNGYGTNYGVGTQTNAGSGDKSVISGGFGYGGNGVSESKGYGGAGGGGWYGGSGTYPDGSGDDDCGGCGGSGYVLTTDSYKPSGYLLDENYYLTETQLVTGGQDTLYPAPITGMVIDVITASTLLILAHDSEGYKYYDSENGVWTFLKSDDISTSDFEEYGLRTFVNDNGLDSSYDLYVLDTYDSSNTMRFNVLPPEGIVKFRYHTEHMLSRFNVDSDVDDKNVSFDVTAKRQGVAEDAYIYFTFNYNLHDIPDKDTRVYSIQGFTQGSSWKYHEPQEPIKTLDHIDLLPVGNAINIPSRFKNYIGSFIDGTEGISTINSAVVCEHNRCIYSVTVCNDKIVRFAKLNLVNNTSSVIKDIPKSQIGNTYFGDIKVDDNYIYLTSSNNDNSYSLWRTPNGPDTTVNTFQVTNSDIYRIGAAGKMEWYDNHTIMLMMRKGLAYFDTVKAQFRYVMFPDNTQNNGRRDYALGKYHVLSVLNGASKSAYVINPETGACESLSNTYGVNWNDSQLNNVCYHDGKFYVVQRNSLHVVDDETMTMDYTQPTPFTSIDPKQIVYSNGMLYIIMQNQSAIYMYDIKTKTFYATGMPFKTDNWQSNGWIRMCAFKGYCFVPQIRLYTINFVERAKYNLGYKYDQFVIVTNKENAEQPDNEYEYDDRFVTFTDDNMWIHSGNIDIEMIEVSSENHIKKVSMTKDQYNKIIKTSFLRIEPPDSGENGESEGT